MRVVVIGSTGHIGTYLVPRLIASGHEVIAVSRSKRDPYADHGAWKFVTRRQIDRTEEEARGTFGETIRVLRPDVVIDPVYESLCSLIEHRVILI